MRIITTSLPLGLDQLSNDQTLAQNPIKKTIEYDCDEKNKKINLEIIDVPKEARKLLLVLAVPEEGAENSYYWITWAMMEPAESPFVNNRNTELVKEEMKKEDYKNRWRGNSENLYHQLCDPYIKAYKLVVFALENEPKIDPKIRREQLEELIEGHVIESTEDLLIPKEK